MTRKKETYIIVMMVEAPTHYQLPKTELFYDGDFFVNDLNRARFYDDLDDAENIIADMHQNRWLPVKTKESLAHFCPVLDKNEISINLHVKKSITL